MTTTSCTIEGCEDGEHVLTPVGEDRVRLHLRVSCLDAAKVGKGLGWQAVVTDLETQRQIALRSRACGSGCHCDAEVVTFITSGPNVAEAIDWLRRGLARAASLMARRDMEAPPAAAAQALRACARMAIGSLIGEAVTALGYPVCGTLMPGSNVLRPCELAQGHEGDHFDGVDRRWPQ